MVMRERAHRPLLLIDIAVPRDIDSACSEIEGVTLYDIDDLQAVIARNRKVRQAEARKAEGIIEEEIKHFAAWLGSLEVLPTIAAVPANAPVIRRLMRSARVSTEPPDTIAFWRATLSKICCGVMPSVASLAWLSSMKIFLGCSPMMSALLTLGTRRSRCHAERSSSRNVLLRSVSTNN